jgi:hypothetical protein
VAYSTRVGDRRREPRSGCGRLTGESCPKDSNELKKSKFCSNLVHSKSDLLVLKQFGYKYWEIGFYKQNHVCYCIFPKFEFKFELKLGIQKLLIPFEIKLKYLDVLEKYQTWSKILLLHLVAFKIFLGYIVLEFF